MADRGAPVSIELHTVSSPVQHYAGGLRDDITRPSVRLGRQLSMKGKKMKKVTVAPTADESGEQPFQREAVVYRSLPQRSRSERIGRQEGPARMRRASSLTQVDNRYEQWEDLTVNFGDIRQSSRRLEDRIAQQ